MSSDVGLRNARITFRQIEENHTMENILYNKLLSRDFNVDVMAVTDRSRMKVVDSFFSATRYSLPEIRFTHAGITHSVPLSKGINVIIGDNSIGKSLLLHALTGYSKPTSLLPASVKRG